MMRGCHCCHILVQFLVAMGFLGIAAPLVVAFSAFNFDERGAVIRTATDQEVPPPTVKTINLGQDRFIKLLMPSNSRQLSQSSSSSQQQHQNTEVQGTKIRTDDGGGDVVWPAGFALSRLIAHAPLLVHDQNVLELGCGLGVVAAAACKYGLPHHVAVSDCDRSALALAYASCTQLQRSRASVSRCCMDWTDRSSWPAQEYDLLLASDVLYDKANVLPLTNVLQYYLCNGEARDSSKGKRAILVDPANQINRDAFLFAARKAGLFVELKEFPGSKNDPNLVLINVSPFAS